MTETVIVSSRTLPVSDPELVFGFHSSHVVMCVLIHQRPKDSTLADKVLKEDAVGFAKTFPEKPCVSQILGGPSLRLGILFERLSIPPGIG